MKTLPLLVLAFAVTAFSARSQESEPTEVERGAHSRTWQTVRQFEGVEGAEFLTNRFQELQLGLHRWTEQGWVVTDPRIELFQDGAVVRNLQFQIIFGANLAGPNAIDILLPGGEQRLVGGILGVAYTEGENSVLLAEVQDCAGEVTGPGGTELVFRNAFTDYEMDVRFIVQRARISQWLVIKNRLPPPMAFGLSEHAVLELFTEWTDFPPLQKELRSVRDVGPRAGALTDERIRVGGVMEFLPGRAFTLGEGASVPVRKSIEQIDGRTFLIEKIPWLEAREELDKLPEAREAARQGPRRNGKFLQAGKGRSAPVRRQARATVRPIRMARGDLPPERGFVADWDLVTTTNGIRFQRDRTYYVSGEVVMSGSNVAEGGVCIKFAPTNNARLNLTGTLYCDSSQYAAITLTSRDDHSIGESIGSASLSGYYASTALNIGDYASDLKHLRISYAQKAIVYENDATGPHTLTHAQLVHCQNGIVPEKTVYHLRNVLMYDVMTNFLASPASSSTGRCEHLTINLASTLNFTNSSTNSLFLTNSLLVAITNSGAGYITNDSSGVGTDTSSANVFQTVGGSSHYLLNNTYRDLGTTNIDASLLADLKTMTTYPPLLLTNSVTVDTTLSPQAQRDTDTPDYGYHLAPLDWVAGGTIVTNATLLLTNGVALGTYGASGSYGVSVDTRGKLFSEGTATALNRVVRYNTVQEQATTNWSSSTTAPGIKISSSTSPVPEARFRFTDWSVPGGSGDHFYFSLAGDQLDPVGFEHCQFGGGGFYAKRRTVGLTNCLWQRVSVTLDDARRTSLVFAYNNLFYGGSVTLNEEDYDGENSWEFYDNLFDRTTISQSTDLLAHNYNGYITNANRLSPSGGNDQVLTNVPTYLTSTLGKYYYPTGDGMLSLLIDTGSRYATNAGLYHFTTTTNKEATSKVDIGFHFVAVTNGLPIDTDGDGIPDYLEDYNGNGIYNSGSETNWQTYNSPNGLTGSPGLQVFTPLR